MACPAACAALCRRRRDVLCAPHANCADACRPNLACSRDLHKNAPDFALEIWNDCVVRLCGICLYQQPCKSAQRSYAGRFAAGAGCTMVLSAGRDLLSCDLLAVCRHRLLSYDAQCAEDGRGRKFCTDLVCVLGAAAGVHCAESVYDSQVCGHSLYRACFAGVFCDLHRTFVFDAFLQRNLPSDGNQYQPECEIAAGEPAAFYAAAALRKPESCH